jgi:multidrug efflux pump subunit AcrA (membrane-fusion protein)
MKEEDKQITSENEAYPELNDEDLKIESGDNYLESDRLQEESTNLKRQLVIIGGIFGVLILAILGWWIWSKVVSKPTEEADTEASVVVSVSVAKVERKAIAGEVAAVGSIFPVKQAVVSANSGGQIKGLRILQNEFVSRGDLLATVDTRDLQAQRNEAEAVLSEARLNVQTLKQSTIPQADIQSGKDLKDAQAAVDNARNLYERRKTLYDKDGIALKDVEAAQLALTQAENNLKFLENSKNLRSKTSNSLDLQTAQARVAQAEQRIKTLQTQMNLAEIRAPVSGFVVEQTQFDGEYATAGGKILTIADLSEVVVKTQFADTVIPNLKFGDAVAIYPDDLNGERMSGKVTLISRSTDPNNRATEVWVNLGNGAGRLRSGGAANVVISENEQLDALVAPNSAVTLDTSDAKTGIVMVVNKENIAHETKVEIGIRTATETQILSGLNEGDAVIIDGNYALPDGTKVEIKQDETNSN